MKTKKIFWGIALVLIAVLLILNAIDVIPNFETFAGEISWWSVFISLLLLSYILTKLVKGKIGGIFIPLALIFMLFERNIATLCEMEDKNIINNGLLLLCAVMLKIGFSLLFKSKKSKHKYKLSASVAYVDLQNLNDKHFSNSLGELVIRFENVEQHIGKKTIYVDNKLGETVIEVPSCWYCICNLKNSLGDISMDTNASDVDAPTLVIEGNNKLGEIVITFV